MKEYNDGYNELKLEIRNGIRYWVLYVNGHHIYTKVDLKQNGGSGLNMEWTKDEGCMHYFDKLMVDNFDDMNSFLQNMHPYFTNDTTYTLLRLAGFFVNYYNDALKGCNGDEVEALHTALRHMTTNPLLAELLHTGGLNIMNGQVNA